MKTSKLLLLCPTFVCIALFAQAQGTFQNLNFEFANVSAYPSVSENVPIALAMPGWNAYYVFGSVGASQTTEVWYNGISLGGAIISVIDANAPAFGPLQGNYSVALFGGGVPPIVSSTISQTGLIPDGTMSLQVAMWWSSATPIITLDGQPINMALLQSFPGYGLYGGDISSFAGQTVELSFTEPPPAQGSPSMFFFDDIVFSPQVFPEPSSLGLLALGSLLIGWRFVCGRQCASKP